MTIAGHQNDEDEGDDGPMPAHRPADRPPPGWEPYGGSGDFTTRNGPYYMRREGDRLWRGFRIRKRHCNRVGIIHGGMLTAFADTLLAMGVFMATRRQPLTIRMTADFLSTARPGDWLEGTGWAEAVDGDLVYSAALIQVGERKVMTAKAVFKALEREGRKSRSG